MIDTSLTHAESVYDPVKAREYYLRTRELKGRESTKDMDDSQKESWAIAKSGISEGKKEELKKAQESQKANLEAIRQKAEATRERIEAKLDMLLSKLKATAEKAVPPPKLIPLEQYPSNLTVEQRDIIIRRNAKTRSLNGKAISNYKRDVAAVKKATSEEMSKAREASRAERRKVGGELKSAVNDARNAYMAAKQQIAEKYESARTTEYDRIRSQA